MIFLGRRKIIDWTTEFRIWPFKVFQCMWPFRSEREVQKYIFSLWSRDCATMTAWQRRDALPPHRALLTQHAARTITWVFEYFRESIRGLTVTPPTPLNVAALCHLTAVPIFLPYPDSDARWKQKERQEDFNIALRSHTICPFHEPAEGRGGNTSPRYKQTAAYFKVTRKSQRLQGSSGVIVPDIVKSPHFGVETIAQP